MKIACNSEFEPIKSVLLHIPREEELTMASAAEAMYLKTPRYQVILDEISEYIHLLEKLGITVYHDREIEGLKPYPNMIYMRDLGGPLEDGIIIGHPRWPIRQGEEDNLRKILDVHHYQGKRIELPKEITFEGADMLWTGKNELTFSVGNRTNIEVIDFLQQQYPNLRYHTVLARPEGVPQHLLGANMIVDHDLIIVRTELVGNRIGNFKSVIALPESDEVKKKFAANVIVIAPRTIIMPNDCPGTQKIYESYGIKCYTSPMSELRKGAGGFACQTLVLERQLQ